MKFGLIAIAALVASAFGAHFLLQDPGYVVISFRGYLIEMSVPILIALILFLIISLWLAAKLLRAPRQLGEAAGHHVGCAQLLGQIPQRVVPGLA